MKRLINSLVIAAATGLFVGLIVWVGGSNLGLTTDIIRISSFGSALAAASPMVVGASLRAYSEDSP